MTTGQTRRWWSGWSRLTPLNATAGLLGAAAALLSEAATLVCGRRVTVAGASMYPLLRPGDRVVIDRLAFRVGRPARGDVVLVRRPERRMLKLVAGLPGEVVAVARDRLWIDGRPVAWPDDRPLVGSLPGRWRLGPDEYFLLSYAVAVGTDSRHFGAVPGAALLGRARLVYWPAGRRRRLPTVPLVLEDAAETGL